MAGALLSLAGELTLVGVHVVASTPAPDSGAQETLRSGATALPDDVGAGSRAEAEASRRLGSGVCPPS
jgi:hypothetical protein